MIRKILFELLPPTVVNKRRNTIWMMWSTFCYILILKASVQHIVFHRREHFARMKENLYIIFTQTSFWFRTNSHLPQWVWTTFPNVRSLRAALGCKSIYHFFNLRKNDKMRVMENWDWHVARIFCFGT